MVLSESTTDDDYDKESAVFLRVFLPILWIAIIIAIALFYTKSKKKKMNYIIDDDMKSTTTIEEIKSTKIDETLV